MFTPGEVLDMAVRLEKNGESVYRKAIQNISDPKLAAALEWMADEEADHAKLFSKLKSTSPLKSKDIFSEELSSASLQNLIGEQSFSLQEIDFSQVHQLDDLIEIFIEFENDSILFYEMLMPFIRDDDTQAQLKQIISEEKSHIEELRSHTITQM